MPPDAAAHLSCLIVDDSDGALGSLNQNDSGPRRGAR